MKNTSIFFVIVNGIFISNMLSQTIDSFEDGDFTNNPPWNGSVASWEITSSNASAGASGSNTLHLNDTSAFAGIKYLSMQRTISWGIEQSWSFWIGRRSQAFTTTNNVEIWIFSNESDLSSSTVDGYVVTVGDNSGGDNIFLKRYVDGLGVATIITSADTLTNGLTDIGFMIRVTRSTTGEWTLYTSILPTANGNGAVATSVPSATNTTVNQGSAIDNTYSDFTNGYMGILVEYTSAAIARTSVEFDQLYFDTSASSALPVELTSFTAGAKGRGIELSWQTAMELNNHGFEIEKEVISNQLSLNSWSKIGFVEGSGSSNSSKKYSFVDHVNRSGTYAYRLRQIDRDGRYTYSAEIVVTINGYPETYSLEQNFPNPFNPTTTIQFNIPDGLGNVRTDLTVYDMLGRTVTSLVHGEMSAGAHFVQWDASHVAAGVYFYTLRSDDFTATKKMLLIK